jgi:hypothetical protein
MSRVLSNVRSHPITALANECDFVVILLCFKSSFYSFARKNCQKQISESCELLSMPLGSIYVKCLTLIQLLASFHARNFCLLRNTALLRDPSKFITCLFLYGPTSNPPARGPPLVGCPRLLIQCIHSYLLEMEVVSSIWKLRTRHALLKRD